MKSHPITLFLAPILSLGLLGCGGGDDAPKAAAPTGEKIDLRMNMAKGDKKDLVMDMDIDMDIKAGGRSMGMNMDIQMDMGFEVLEVDGDGNHDLKVQFDSMKMKVSGPASVEYDSTVKGSDETPVGREISPLIGFPFTMKMTPAGEVTEVGGLDDAPPAIREQFSQTQDSMKMMATLPKEPIDNGDTWELKTSQTQGGKKMDMLATYTLLERKDGEAIIDIQGTLSGGFSGTVSGEMRLDIATGWVNSGSMKMSAEGKEAGSDVQMEMALTFSGE